MNEPALDTQTQENSHDTQIFINSLNEWDKSDKNAWRDHYQTTGLDKLNKAKSVVLSVILRQTSVANQSKTYH